MKDAVRNYCQSEGKCLRKYLLAHWTQIKNILNHFPRNIFVVVFASQSANVQVAMMSLFQSDIHLGGGKHYSHFR